MDLFVFFSFCLKPPANKFSTGSQQPTYNRSSLNSNGHRPRDYCWQESNARSSQAHAGHQKRSVNSACNIGSASVLFIHWGSEVSFFETESDLSHMLKLVVIPGLERWVEGHCTDKVCPVQHLNGLYSLIVTVVWSEESPLGMNQSLLRETGMMLILSRFKRRKLAWCWLPSSVNCLWGDSWIMRWTPTLWFACFFGHLSLKPGTHQRSHQACLQEWSQRGSSTQITPNRWFPLGGIRRHS